MMLGLPKEAVSNYQMTWKLTKSVYVLNDLAAAYVMLKQFNLASHYADEFIRLMPKREAPFGYYGSFLAYLAAGRTEERQARVN